MNTGDSSSGHCRILMDIELRICQSNVILSILLILSKIFSDRLLVARPREIDSSVTQIVQLRGYRMLQEEGTGQD